MSEPIKNAAIEDVLSSIRRLVSEDYRRDLQQPAPPAQPAPAPRLVLTPSLRVTTAPDDSAIPEPSPADPQDISGAGTGQVEPGASLGSINAGRIQGFADEKPDDGSVAGAATVVSDVAQEGLRSVPWANPDKTTLFEAARVEVLVDPLNIDLPRETPEPEDENTVALQPPAETEPQQTESTSETDIPELKDAADAFDFAEPVDFSESVDSADPVGLSDTPESAEPVDFAELPDIAEPAEPVMESLPDDMPLASRIAAMEAVIASTADQWEPDGDVGDDYAGTQTRAMEWQDHPVETGIGPAGEDEFDADDLAEVTFETVRKAPEIEETLEETLTDDSFLDEDSMRELVAEIVRQELQGALGERITRNVRKLVRREIHRALAAHDLG